jgi:fructose-1,6-bisphosphatase/sedoheptulose 1,7-bisphosphatase-like protein
VRGGKGHSRSLATKVNHALSEVSSRNNCLSQLTVTIRNKSRTKINDNLNLAARVSAKIEEGYVRGAVWPAVSDDSLAPHSESTVEALRQLHPSRVAPTIN